MRKERTKYKYYNDLFQHSFQNMRMLVCTYVNILSDEENALASHTESTMLVSHLVDGDVVYSSFDVIQGALLP
jgi:hypothetical protein